MTNQATRNKRAGAAWETQLLKGLREKGFEVERLRLAGRDDEGDLAIRHDAEDWTVIEAKSGALHAADFIRQIEIERANFAKSRGLTGESVEGVVVVKRRGESWEKAYVLTTLDHWLGVDCVHDR